MDKDFVQYEEALELKELEFNEPCFAFFNGKYHDWLIDDNNGLNSPTINPNKDIGRCVKRPTYSQAFRWFREKHNLHSYIEGAYPWFRFYINSEDDRWEGFKHTSYEEAELECLRKLIKIVKDLAVTE